MFLNKRGHFFWGGGRGSVGGGMTNLQSVPVSPLLERYGMWQMQQESNWQMKALCIFFFFFAEHMEEGWIWQLVDVVTHFSAESKV